MPSPVSTSKEEHDLNRKVLELERNLAEAQQQQRAISEVLEVINSSAGNPAPAFDAMLNNATRLCQADCGILWTYNGERFRAAALRGTPPAFVEFAREPLDGDSSAALTEILYGAKFVHVADLSASEDYRAGSPLRRAIVDLCGARTGLAVALRKDDALLGIFVIYRQEVRPFTDREIDLLKSFASQAVIAIENTRLLEAKQAQSRELTEALEQQTATADVLKVISRSALDLQRVLDALVESAVRLCNAYDAVILQVFGDGLRLVAHHGQISIAGPVGQLTIPLERESIGGRAVIDRRTIHVADILAEADEYPESRKRAHQLGWRTLLAVPLVHAGEAIGVILIRRAEVRPFTERQIELVSTFADQAVIAIENARLFEEVQARTRELTQSLEYQTATSEVLSVISRSPTTLQPVLLSIATTAARLCNCLDAQVYRLDGARLKMVGQYGSLPSTAVKDELPLTRGSVTGRAVVDRRTVHVEDIAAVLESEYPDAVPSQLVVGHRTTLATPLLREGEPLGAILLRRTEVRPFSPQQIALLQTFADQAVIAIENTRLFEEIAQKSRELEIASEHKSRFVANMSHELRTPLAAILGYAELLGDGMFGELPEKSIHIIERVQVNGKHLLGLINSVLDISKIEAGQFNLSLGEYSLDSMVETVRVATEALASTKKLSFRTDVAKGLPFGVGDEPRLTQVLLNLVGNAIKFTDAGEVCISAGAKNGSSFVVSVSDTGPGIPNEERERIFDKFHQVDSTSTRTKGGTGLGLAISKEIIELHGGRVWVESIVGRGSIFRLELPVRVQASGGAA